MEHMVKYCKKDKTWLCLRANLCYLFSHDFQMADVVLETRFSQTELITQALQLGAQLFFIFHRLDFVVCCCFYFVFYQRDKKKR